MQLVMACTSNGGVGFQGGLPWPNNPEDLRLFKERTINRPILMGRKTWESLPRRPLPGRDCNVVTSTPGYTSFGYSTFSSVEEYIQHTPDEQLAKTKVIGGAELAKAAFPYIRSIILTKIGGNYESDTFLDLAYIESNFDLVKTIRHGCRTDELYICKFDWAYELDMDTKL